MVNYLGIEEGDLELALISVPALAKSILENEDKSKSWHHLPAALPKIESGEKGVLMAVADGMGGQGPKGSGRKASEIVINALNRYYTNNFPKHYTCQNILEDLLVNAHYNIQRESETNPESFKDMGSTAAVALILKRQDSKGNESGDLYDVHTANVGDTRIYYAKKSITDVNNSDSMINYSLEKLTVDDVPKNINAENVLLQSLGMKGKILVHYNYAAKVCSGDFLILCSDGAYKPMRTPEQTITEIIKEEGEPQSVVERLRKIHNINGKKDDFSVIVAQFI